MRRSQTSLVLLILGVVLVIGGIIYGSRSHYLGYKSSGPAKIAHAVVDPNSDTSSSKAIVYLQLQNDPNIYYMNTAEFVNEGDSDQIENPTAYGVSYDDAVAVPVNVTGEDTATEDEYTIKGTAYHLVQLTGYEGSHSATINTRQFIQNPQGRYENDWPAGTGAIVLGALLLIVGFILRRGAQIPGAPNYVVMQPGQMTPYPGQPSYPGAPMQPSQPSYPTYSPVQPTYQAQPSQPAYPIYPPAQLTPQAQPSQPTAPTYSPEQATPQIPLSQPYYPTYSPIQPAQPAQAAYPPNPFAQPAPSEQYGMGQYTQPSSSPAQQQPISPEGGTAYGGNSSASQPSLSNNDPDATQIGKLRNLDEE